MLCHMMEHSRAYYDIFVTGKDHRALMSFVKVGYGATVPMTMPIARYSLYTSKPIVWESNLELFHDRKDHSVLVTYAVYSYQTVMASQITNPEWASISPAEA